VGAGLGPVCVLMRFRKNTVQGQGWNWMWYFAYGSNLNSRAVAEWARHFGHRPPAMKSGKPAILDNYRLCFPIFSEYWGGGIADIVYDPGKYVSGALFDLSEAEMKILDQKVERKLDGSGKEVGVYKRIEVKIAPLGKAEPVMATTYQGTNVERYNIPPTQHYMDLVIQGAYSYGLSMMWVSYLQSFSTQTGRKPRPPGYGDQANKM
jgi:gamma-glutamylcyclotransferase